MRKKIWLNIKMGSKIYKSYLTLKILIDHLGA